MRGGELTLERYEKVFMGVPEKKKLFSGTYFLRIWFASHCHPSWIYCKHPERLRQRGVNGVFFPVQRRAAFLDHGIITLLTSGQEETLK